MLDKKFLNKNIDDIVTVLLTKKHEFPLELYLELETKRKSIQINLENLQKEKNDIANKIPIMYKNKVEISLINELKKKGGCLNNDILKEKLILEDIDLALKNILLKTPNIPNKNCPIGNDEEDNLEIKKFMEPTIFNFRVKDHVELGELLNNSLSFDKGVDLAKSRFSVIKNDLALLHRALGQFMLNLHTQEHGYMEFNLPVIVNKKSLIGTGQLPKFENDLFKIEGTDLALIPTAEVPLTNLFSNETLNENDFPVKITAKTLCFRSEAGSAGRDVKGILRQHQFEKVELVQLAKPENSEEVLLQILNDAEKVLKLLKLPYRVVELCTGDLGFGSAHTYDIEVWVPSQNKYREISSCSNMTDFQSRRLNIKYLENGKKHLVHTLNGSGLAIGRTLLAVMENYQTEDGRIIVPEVLIPYMNGKVLI